MIPYSIHPEAEEELREAAFFYDLQRIGLGTSFKEAVEATIDLICEYLDVGSPFDGALRRQLVHGYPYFVVYEHVRESIFVLAVANARRRPDYWRGRLER